MIPFVEIMFAFYAICFKLNVYFFVLLSRRGCS